MVGEKRNNDLRTLMQRCKLLNFGGTTNYYPSLDMIRKDTSVQVKNDRAFYLWVLVRRTPRTDEDLECELYIKKSLMEFDPKYYGALEEVLLEVRESDN